MQFQVHKKSRIFFLPKKLAKNFKVLQKLFASMNHLTALPGSIGQCTRLKKLRIVGKPESELSMHAVEEVEDRR